MYNCIVLIPNSNVMKLMSKLFKNSRDNAFLALILSVSTLVIFSPIYLQNKPFLFLNDQVTQYNIFYTEWIRLVRVFLEGGSLPFYSWNKFLGSDFFSSSAYYTVGDVFLPILLMFEKVENALIFETIALIFMSGFFFKAFLMKFGITNKKALLLVPYVYALNGFVALYFGNYMFHRFYAFLPLLFIGIEKAIQNKKYLLFVFSVSLLFLQNFYLMFPITLYLVIYVIFSYQVKKLVLFDKQFFVNNLLLIIYYLLGVGLIAFFLIPAFHQVLLSPRIAQSSAEGLFWNWKVYVGFFASFNNGPFPIITNVANIFQVGLDGHAFWYSLYLSTFLFSILLSFLFHNRSLKNPYVLSLIIILFVLLVLPLNSLFHGLSEPSMRVSIILVFQLLLTVAHAIESTDFKMLLKTYLKYVVIYLVMILMLIILNVIQLKVHTIHLLTILGFLGLGILGLSVIQKFPKLTALIIILEITLNLGLQTYFTSNVFYFHADNLIQDYVDYYQEIDDDLLFRNYVDPIHFLPSTSLNLNQSLVYNYMSTSSYDSFYEPELNDFLRLNGFNWHIIHLSDPEILKLLGVKYYIAYEEAELPDDLNYIYSTTINHLKVYQDLDYLPIGFTFSNFKVLDDTVVKHEDWLSVLLIEEEDLRIVRDIKKTERVNFNVDVKYGNGLFGTIELSSPQVLFLSIPFNKGWDVTVDGVSVEVLKVDGGFIGIKLDGGYHEIGLKFTPYGFKFGIILALISAVILFIMTVIRIINQRRTNHA